MKLPTLAGSPAPAALLASVLPPRPVARKPGEMVCTRTLSERRVRCLSIDLLDHSKIVVCVYTYGRDEVVIVRETGAERDGQCVREFFSGTVPLIIIFIPHLLLLYAAILLTPAPPCFGHPASGTLLIGRFRFSVPLSVDVPLVMNNSRGADDLSKSGMKVEVKI